MPELPSFKFIGDYAVLSRVEMFSDARIAEMLDKAEALGFDLNLVPTPLEDLTLRELDILTTATRGSN
jgi:hypothetical protein